MTAISTFVFIIMSIVSFIIYKVHNTDYTSHVPSGIPKKPEKKAAILYDWLDTDTGETYFCSYNDILRHEKWIKYRERVLKYHKVCDVCGTSEKLQIHHNVYFTTKGGYKIVPWCYCNKNVSVLCDKCHKTWHMKYRKVYRTLKF